MVVPHWWWWRLRCLPVHLSADGRSKIHRLAGASVTVAVVSMRALGIARARWRTRDEFFGFGFGPADARRNSCRLHDQAAGVHSESSSTSFFSYRVLPGLVPSVTPSQTDDSSLQYRTATQSLDPLVLNDRRDKPHHKRERERRNGRFPGACSASAAWKSTHRNNHNHNTRVSFSK